MSEMTMTHRLLAYAFVSWVVSLPVGASGPAGRGGAKAGAEKAAVSVLDCRRPAEIGHPVPHERLIWMPSAEEFDAQRFPRFRPHGERPGVIELIFDGKLDTSVVLNCGGPSSELIHDVDARGRTVTVTLVEGDVRWRVDRSAHALIVWSPRSIARAISQAWPGHRAAEILAQARQLGTAPENVDQLERRLAATLQRKNGLEALAEARYDQAARDLAAAFEAVPNDVEAGLALARARYQLRQYDGAEELLESLAHVAPRSAEIRHEQGLLALSVDQRSEARAHFSVAADGGWPNAHFYLGFLAFEAEDDATAAQALDRYLAVDGKGPLASRARTMREVISGRGALRTRAAPAEAPVRAAPRVPAATAPPPRPAVRTPATASLYARPLVLRGFGQRDVSLGTFEGRPLVLHFWATWCPPCRREIPSLMRFVARDLPALAERGMALLTVSMDYTEDELAGATGTWAAENEGALPAMYWDPSWVITEALELGTALPQTVFVLPDGTVETVLIGAQDWQDPHFLERLARLVGPREDRLDD